jgi:hypothetical protein
MRPPIYLVELPSLTPREVALKSCPPNEKETQELTLYLEITRAEKRYASMVALHTNARYGKEVK